MKKLFKGAIPTIALLLVAIMSLTGVTYAWFSAGHSATVDTVKVDVKSIDGLLVSSTGKNGTWGSYITPDLTGVKALTEASTIGELSPVTWDTTGKTKTGGGELLFYSAAYNADFDAVVASSAIVNNTVGDYNGYISFPVFIKNDNDTAIWVDLKGSTVSGTNFSKYASRVAIVQEGVASATQMFVDGTYAYDYSEPSLLGIWEPNAEIHTSDGAIWLANNNKDSGAQKTYKGLYAALTSGTQYEAGYWFINVANGEKYAIAATADVALSARQHTTTKDYYNVDNLPKGAEYYVFESTITGTTGSYDADHFKRLTINDYFAPIAFKDIAGLNGKLASDWENLVYTYDSDHGEFDLVKANTTVSTTTDYYVLKNLTTDTRKEDELVVFSYEKYQPISSAISLQDVANDGLTLADLAVGGKNVSKVTAFVYNSTLACYTPITLDLDDFFAVADSAAYTAALTKGATPNTEAALYTKGTGVYNLVTYEAISGMNMAITDGTKTTYTFDLTDTKVVRPGTFALNSTALTNVNVDSDGKITATELAATGSSINFATGEVTLVFATAPAANKDIFVDCELAPVFADNTYYTLRADVTTVSGALYSLATVADSAALTALEAKTTVYVKNASNEYVSNAGAGYDGDKNYFVKKALYAEEYSAILKDVTTIQTTTTSSDNAQYFQFMVDANTIGQYRVYIWLEGQDCDCTNSVAGVPFNVNLVFNKKSAKTPDPTPAP